MHKEESPFCWDSDVLLPLDEIACTIRLIGEGARASGSECEEMVAKANTLMEQNLWDIYEIIDNQVHPSEREATA